MKLSFIIILTLMGWTATAQDRFGYHYADGKFEADFKQRTYGHQLLIDQQYKAAAQQFKLSFISTPSQQALYYFQYALKHLPTTAQPVLINNQDTIIMRSVHPLDQLTVDGINLPVFLYTRWHDDDAVTTLPADVLSLLARDALTMSIHPFDGNPLFINLSTSQTPDKLVFSWLSDTTQATQIGPGIVDKSQSALASNVTIVPVETHKVVKKAQQFCHSAVTDCDQQLEDDSSASALIDQSHRRQVRVQVNKPIKSSTHIAVEVFVAIVDLNAQQTMAVKAFFNRKPLSNSGELQRQLALDIAHFISTFKPGSKQ